MRIDRFDPRNIKETQKLTKIYCMPTDSKKFIKWRGKFRRKGYGSVTIEIDTHRYLEQIHEIYVAKNHKGFTLEDIATICQLRYMAASSSLKNAEKSKVRLSDYVVVTTLLKKIMIDSEEIYRQAMCKIDDKAMEELQKDMEQW